MWRVELLLLFSGAPNEVMKAWLKSFFAIRRILPVDYSRELLVANARVRFKNRAADVYNEYIKFSSEFVESMMPLDSSELSRGCESAHVIVN